MTPEDKKQALTQMKQELIQRGKKIDELHMALLEHLTTRTNSFSSFLLNAIRIMPGIVDPLVDIIEDVERNTANMMIDMKPELDQMSTFLYKRLQKGKQSYLGDLAQLSDEEKELLALYEDFDPESVNPSKMRLSQEEMELLEMFGGHSKSIHYDSGKQIRDVVGEEDNAPEKYLCPISHCIMMDPVTLPETLKTYDRASIENHFRYCTAKKTLLFCPLTNISVSGSLISNHTLRDEIKKWSKSRKEEGAPTPQLTDKSLTSFLG